MLGTLLGQQTREMRCAINLAGKVVTEFEKTDAKFERCSTVSKMVSNSIPWYRDIFQERKNQSM
jgi:hypothetical protein